jgi:pimeloyl-ACP methyl ester carboxylesterase/tellurite resistance protein
MRQRGNNYLSHLRAGQPPALAFEYEPILDAMDFDPPVNYALVRILERRTEDKDRRQRARKDKSRREQPAVSSYKKAKTSLRPLVVIDPRAGHGPGIGGSKLESQIGVALEYGHPVYFIMFSTDPAPGQTIAAVQQAEIRFLEEVGRRHADAPKPAVIGNCQAGWAAALIGADRPDVVGPMVLNGSPLSYWGGVEGANPMRYKGGLCGGIWLSTLWSDLGNGHFDGAHLVAGFEDLNPTNTYWSKPYHLFTNVDTETERFLNFEKWWGGFFKLSAHEIHFITSSLFVGNELEKGLVELQQGRPVNLKNFKDPIFVFASRGDNITPPPQALNWIVKVYGSTEEIKHQGQVIIYMVHENIGHLGIFVSGRVAAKEHREIIGCLEMMPYLAPGLYEMVITDDARNPEISDYAVRFEEREMSDILKLDDGLADENAFVPVAALSQFNDAFYRVWVQPWVRSIANPWLADWLRQMHPLRFQRYAWSDLNPLSWIFYFWSLPVKHERRPASPQNPFVAAETIFSLLLTATLGYLSNTRDLFQEWLFKSVYASPWLKFCLGSQATDQKMSVKSDEVALQHREKDFALQNAGQGEFAEAVIRIILAVAGADRILEKSQFDAAEKIIRHHHRFRDQTPATIRQMVADQARILSADINLALAGLALILTTHPERLEAFDIAIKIAVADFRVDFKETTLLTEIRRVLELDHDD